MKKTLPIILLFLCYNISTAQSAGNASTKGLIESTFPGASGANSGAHSGLSGDLVENGTSHIYWKQFNSGASWGTIQHSQEEDHTGDGGGSIKIIKTLNNKTGGIFTQRGNSANSNCLDVKVKLNHLSENTTLQSDDDVILKFWVKGTAGTGAIRGRLRDGNSGSNYDNGNYENITDTWTEISVNLGVADHNFASPTTGLQFHIHILSGYTGTFYIDDITVTGLDVLWDGSVNTKVTLRGNYGDGGGANYVASKYEDLFIPGDLLNYPELKETSFIVNNLRIGADSDNSNDSDSDGTTTNDGKFIIQHSEGNNGDGVSGNENYPRLLQVNGNLLVDNGGVLTINRGSEIHVKGDFTDSNASIGNIIFQSDSDRSLFVK